MSVIQFDAAGALVCHTREDLYPESIMAFIVLPTADDTQTALAKANVFLSETTAIRWRKEKNFVHIAKSLESATDEEAQGASTSDCTIAAKRFWKQMVTKIYQAKGRIDPILGELKKP